MKLSKYFAVFFAVLLAPVSVASTVEENDESKQIQYLALVFGDTSYQINEVQIEHQLKNGSERTVRYSIGTKLCVTSETGLLVLKDSENTEHYVNKTSGCHTVTAVNEPTLMQKVSRYIPETTAEGEASVPGLTLFTSSSQEDETESADNGTGADFTVSLNPSGSLIVLSKVWAAKEGATPIQLQITSAKGELLSEQLSMTSGFTYFAVPASVLTELENASLIVMDKNGNQLMDIKLQKGDNASWIYTAQD